MARPPVIRALKQEDLKMVRYQLGLSLLAPLGVANNRGCLHPWTLSIWIALSSVMIHLMNWWPTTKGALGILGVLAPLPALAAVAVPIMFWFDWVHRPSFEGALHDALTAPDMRDPLSHYSRSPASGFYILENNDQPIGLIALDAVTLPEPSSGKHKVKTAETAVIRHFFVESAYRRTKVQDDLLEFAVSRAFGANSSSPRRVRAVSNELESYKAVALRAANFDPVSRWDSSEPKEWKTGIYGWKSRWVELTRDEWKAKSK